MRLFAGLLLLIFSYLQYSLWFSKASVHSLRKKESVLQESFCQNKKLAEKTQYLQQHIHHLKSQNCVVEQAARHEMGMIYPSEYFYRVVKDIHKDSASAHT